MAFFIEKQVKNLLNRQRQRHRIDQPVAVRHRERVFLGSSLIASDDGDIRFKMAFLSRRQSRVCNRRIGRAVEARRHVERLQNVFVLRFVGGNSNGHGLAFGHRFIGGEVGAARFENDIWKQAFVFFAGKKPAKSVGRIASPSTAQAMT